MGDHKAVLRRFIARHNEQQHQPQVTLKLAPELFNHLQAKVIRKIQQGEGATRATVADEIRRLISADMERVDA